MQALVPPWHGGGGGGEEQEVKELEEEVEVEEEEVEEVEPWRCTGGKNCPTTAFLELSFGV